MFQLAQVGLPAAAPGATKYVPAPLLARMPGCRRGLASSPSVMTVAAAFAGRVMVVISALLLSMPEPPQVAPERVPKVVTLVAIATAPLAKIEAIVRYVFIVFVLTGGVVGS